MSIPLDSENNNQLGITHFLSELSSPQSAKFSSIEYDLEQMDKAERGEDLNNTIFSEDSSASLGIMRFHQLNNISDLSQQLGWLMLFVSVGLHGLFLLLPMGAESQHVSGEQKKEKTIKVTQLPSVPKSPITKSQVSSIPKSQVSPITKKNPVPARPIVVHKSVIQPISKNKVAIIKPIPKISAKPPIPVSKTQESVVRQPSKPTPSKPTENHQSQPTSTPSPAPSSNTNPWEDFPRYPTAKPGCFELQSCFQTGKELSEVAAYFEKELSAKKYDFQNTINEANRKVYQVSKNGMTQFLSLIVASQGTVYVLADEPRSLNELDKAVEVPPEINGILDGLDSQDVNSENLAQPDVFYTQSGNPSSTRPEISSMKLVSDQTPDTLFASFFQTNLQNNGFEIAETQKQYGGGAVYEVTKDKLKIYLNLVPSKDGQGTIVVVWRSLPD